MTQAPRKQKTPKRISADYLHNAGLYYLQRFAASTGQFRAVMMRKVDRSCRSHKDQDRAACKVMVDELVEKFTRSGLLDDGAYTRAAVSSLRRRGASARAIGARMKAKGIAPEDIETALEGEEEEGRTDFNAALRLARRKRVGPFRRPGAAFDRNKELAALARAGFGYDTAARALDMDEKEAEELLSGAGL